MYKQSFVAFFLFHEITQGDSIDPVAATPGRKQGTTFLSAFLQRFTELPIKCNQMDEMTHRASTCTERSRFAQKND